MTLNLTMVTQWGVWQCSDHRVTNASTGKIEDDHSMKHLMLICRDGSALLTYTGLGKLSNNEDVSDWLRGLLHCKSLTLDETLILIREEASRRIGPIAVGKYVHMFTVGAFFSGVPWAIQIRNYPDPRCASRPMREFFTAAKRIESEPVWMAAGANAAVYARDRELLAKVVRRRPSRPRDFRNLLAGINLRASQNGEVGRLISPACRASFMPPTGATFESEEHNGDVMSQPASLRHAPILLFGLDIYRELKFRFPGTDKF